MQQNPNLSSSLRAINHIALIALSLLGSNWIYPLILNLFGEARQDFHGPGFTDSIEYWSALQIWLSGQNPYNEQTMFTTQASIRPGSDVLMMWNPPWIFALLYPFRLVGDFVQFAQLWFFGSLAAYVTGIFALIKCFVPESKTDLRLWLICLTFPAFLTSLSFGQLGAWLFLGVALVLIGSEKNSRWAVGVGSFLISLKPHLFVIFVISATVILLRQKKSGLAFTLLASPLLVAFYTESISIRPILSEWLSVMIGVSPLTLAVPPEKWITTSIPSIISNSIPELSHFGNLFIAIFSQIISLIICLKLSERWKASEALSLALLIYIPLGSFAWLFDYTIIAASLIILWRYISKTNNSLSFNLLTILVLSVSCSIIGKLHHALIPLLFFIAGVLFIVKKNSHPQKFESKESSQ